jgi:predicted transposase/invertase (TIGR01784 family)
MSIPSNPHDHFFKDVFTRPEAASDFLRHYLPPQVAAQLDTTALEICKDSFVDPELAEHRSDLLYQVRFHDGGTGYVYVLFEHKSYPEPLIVLDLLRYQLRIWEQWRKAGNSGRLPIILPIVVYHGRTGWSVATALAALVEERPVLAPYVPNFHYIVTDLTRYRDEDIRGEVHLRVAMLLFKYIFRDELRERLPAILGLLDELAQKRSGLEYLETVLRYVARGTDKLQPDELHQALTQVLTGKENIMPTIAEQWIQQGVQQGLGAERQLLLRQARHRFGADVAEASMPLLEQIADPAVLEELGEALLDCPQGEDWLKALTAKTKG